MLFVDVLISWYNIYIYWLWCLCIYIWNVSTIHVEYPLGWDMSYLSIHLSIYPSIYLSIYLSIYIHIDGEINIDGIEWGYILKQYWRGYIFHQYNWSWRICCWWISHWWGKTSSQGCSQAPRCHECLEISWDRTKQKAIAGNNWKTMMEHVGYPLVNVYKTLWKNTIL